MTQAGRDGKPARAGKASGNGNDIQLHEQWPGRPQRSAEPGGQAGGAKRQSSKPRFKNS